jgi:hypothetical protein
VDFAAQVQAAVRRRNEENLRDLLAATAQEAIDAALQAFIRDENLHEYGYTLRPVCEILGNQFTTEDVIRMVTRGGQGNSRTGFNGLETLYEMHMSHLITLGLPEAFEKRGNWKIAYYCKLCERFDGIAWKYGDYLEIDGLMLDLDNMSDKYMNRGGSAFLDSVFAKDWVPPPLSTALTDTVSEDGMRTIEYELEGDHYKVVIDKDGYANEVITRNGKSVSHRRFTEEFNKAWGGWTKTRMRILTTKYDVKGRISQSVEEDFGYAARDVSTERQLIEGWRKTTTYKDDKLDTEKTEHWDLDEQTWGVE